MKDYSLHPWTSRPLEAPNFPLAEKPFLWTIKDGVTSCGGGNRTACHTWNTTTGSLTPVTGLPRSFPRGFHVDLGDGRQWIGGGRGDSGESILKHLLRTEAGGVEYLYPDLPAPMVDVCAARLSETEAVLTGGLLGRKATNKTFVYDFVRRSWTEGPEMSKSRFRHGCASMADSDGGFKVVLGNGKYRETGTGS